MVKVEFFKFIGLYVSYFVFNNVLIGWEGNSECMC